MATPTPPTGLAVTFEPAAARVTWSQAVASPANTLLNWGLFTDAGYTTPPPGWASSYNTAAGTRLELMLRPLAPGVTYYLRMRLYNGTYSTYATISFAVPARTSLDMVEAASVSIGDGVTVSLRPDLTVAGKVEIGYSTLTGGTAWTSIATLADFDTTTYDARTLALVANPAGDLFVVGNSSTASNIRVTRFARTGVTNAWTLAGSLQQNLGFGPNLMRLAATWVPGTGVTPRPSIYVLTRMGGPLAPLAALGGHLTVDPVAVAASAGTLAINSAILYDSNAFYSGLTLAVPLYGSLDVVTLPGTTRVAAHYNGTAVVEVTNGVPAGVAKSTAFALPNGKVVTLAINSTTYAVIGTLPSGDLRIYICGVGAGVSLGTVDLPAASTQGGAFGSSWAAFYDTVDGVIRVYYIADDSARKLESVDVSPTTGLAAAPVVVTSTLGAASSVNSRLRIPAQAVDERKLLVEAANLLTGTQSLASVSDTQGNATPNAPATVDVVGFDATQAYNLTWTFSDPNLADSQTAYELEVQRVSDSVVVVTSGKVASTAGLRTLAAATLANGVNYRWRVRTYDELDTVGAWSAYDAFATAATGTLTITLPVADIATLDVATYDVTWTYSQVNGYVQTQRRVRVIRVSDSAVLSDTTMQATAVGHYVVSLPTGVLVRVEVSIVTNAPGTPTIGPALRLITSTYSDPMPPTAVLSVGIDCIDIFVTNPTPTGSRPEVISNAIERRVAGEVDFVRIARAPYNGSYSDHAVKSGEAYEYQVVGITA